jgi:diacylglycerol kinase (ATP)
MEPPADDNSTTVQQPLLDVTETDAYREKIIAFVNPKSGGLQGQLVFEQLRAQIGEQNVYDLIADHGPQKGLKDNQNEKNLRIIACGGDGTVGWVLSALDTSQMQYMDFVSVGVIPLGTGNDMARFLGLGVGYRGEALAPVIQALAHSESRLLDRWQIDVKPTAHTGTASLKIPQPVFNNYLSFGADAQIALDFHEKRNASPRRYANRLFNKLAYGCISCNTFFDRRYLFGNIANYFELHVDGRNVDEDLFRFRPDAVLILNIASYAAGTNPWQGTYDNLWCARSQADDDRFREQSCSDGYLEIIGFKHFELARIQLGRRGHRIAQGSEIKLTIRRDLLMEIDGEPFLLGPCQIIITRKNQARMIITDRSQAAQQVQSKRV